MKIGVLSDTHLQRVTRDFRGFYDQYLSDMDVILHAGDFVCPEIVEFLSRNTFHGVQGNMDPVEVKALLPPKKVIELGPYRLGLVHGWGPSEGLEDRIRSEFRKVDAIVYGHSHKAANHRKEGVLLFNPGSAGGFISPGVSSIGILELADTINGEIVNIT